MPITIEEAEKQYLEPPDDYIDECEKCGDRDYIYLSKHMNVCKTCKEEIENDELEEKLK